MSEFPLAERADTLHPSHGRLTQRQPQPGHILADSITSWPVVPMRIRASIGVAWSAGIDISSATLTVAADHAMYTSTRAFAITFEGRLF